MDGDDPAPLGAKAWGTSRLALPQGEFVNALTGERHAGGAASVAAILSSFPVALLVRS
ncbi:hypothetical protein D3C83_309380 [compost metagenome]